MRMIDQKWFRAGLWALLVLTIIWVGAQVDFVFRPVVLIVQTVFAPLLIAGILFFLLRPVVRALVSWKVPRILAILLVYLVLTGVLLLALLTIGPMIQTQFVNLMSSLPAFVDKAISTGYLIAQSDWFGELIERSNTDLDMVAAGASEYILTVVNSISSNLTSFVGFVVNIVLVAVVVPFILFFLLKDGESIYEGFVGRMPKARQEDIRRFLLDLDRTIGLFIRGQAIVALSVGVLMYIGFQIIGLNYAVLLALIAMVTNVIPYLGAFLAAAPALLVGLANSPEMALKVLVVTLLAQQIEGNFLSPLIMGKGLAIHPLTIILLLLAAGALLGPAGLLFAIPGYAVLKIVFVHFLRWRQADRSAGER